MKSHLAGVREWRALARAAGYRSRSLARRCHVSPRQLERFFEDTFGQSPQAWLDTLRLKQAAELLQEGKPVKEVAYELGFCHPSHFIRKFKALYRLTPMNFAARRKASALSGAMRGRSTPSAAIREAATEAALEQN